VIRAVLNTYARRMMTQSREPRLASERADLVKHGFLLALLIVGWFALTMLSHNWLIQMCLGWVGLACVVLYFAWLRRKKFGTPKS
jgi:protein-S-isoprenylcysteine O-methyltransferase Ste14